MFRKKSPAAAKPVKNKKLMQLPGLGKKKGNTALVSKPAPSSRAPESNEMGLSDTRPVAKSLPPKKKSGGGPLKLLLPILLIGLLGGGAFFVYTNFLAGGGEPPPPAAAPTEVAAIIPDDLPDSSKSLQVSAPPKQAVDCAGKPKFFSNIGFAGDVTFSTNEAGVRGLIAFGASAENSDAVTRYQHQSWARAGFLDAFVFDQNGNGYFAPSPRTGLGITEPKNQDQIFKLDSTTGVLASYLTLPAAAPTSPANPYGVLGLTYDCATDSLFVTTVTGSSDAEQVGRIFRIDLGANEIVGQQDNVDGYGIAVRDGTNGSQVVFGSPRDALVRALDLDSDGNFQGEPRVIAALSGSLHARKISFPNENEMIVQAAEINYTSGEIPAEQETRFMYDAATDKWVIAN